jgi:hypothetical protein
MILLIASAVAADRDAVLDAAAAYATHEWMMTAENETASCSGDYVSDYTAGTYRGVPYDWGGYYTLDDYDSAIAEGLGAGSHSWHGVLSCTAGVDCSGFVSQVWATDHYGTATIHNVSHEIGIDAVERADAFNDAGSHITLFAYETAGGRPVFYEAAGSASRVRLNGHSGWSYLDGYVPIRYDDIEESPPQIGTIDTPREVAAFPFEDLRWTAGAVSDAIDRYSCAPDADESGPEVVYYFPVRAGGTLRATVTDDEDVDVDIHVLTAPDGDHCVARDDAEVSVALEPGYAWVVVDTYVGSDEFPGPFLLDMTFDGEVGEPVVEEPDPVADDTDLDSASDDGQGYRVPGAKSGCATSPPSCAGVVASLAVLAWMRRRRWSR